MKTMTKAMVTAMGTVTRTKHCNEAPPVPLGWGCFVFPSCPTTGLGSGAKLLARDLLTSLFIVWSLTPTASAIALLDIPASESSATTSRRSTAGNRKPSTLQLRSFDVKYSPVRCQANNCSDQFLSFDSRSISSKSQFRYGFDVDINANVCDALRSLWQTQAQPEETNMTTTTTDDELCILDPDWLIASSMLHLGSTAVLVYRSAWMKDNHRSYRPVLEFVEKNGLGLLYQELGPEDRSMIFNRGEYLVYGEKDTDPEKIVAALLETA